MRNYKAGDIWYDMIWYDMIWYDMIWYDMIWYDMIWYERRRPIWSIWRHYCSPAGRCSGSFLFVVLVDYLLKRATSQLDSGVVTHPRRSRRHQKKKKKKKKALLDSSISRAQAQLTKTVEAAANLGLVISVPKTEYMTVYCNPQPALQVYGDSINHVSDFRYLGSMVASGSSDLKRRKSLAWCALWKLEQLWKSPHISIATKVFIKKKRSTGYLNRAKTHENLNPSLA